MPLTGNRALRRKTRQTHVRAGKLSTIIDSINKIEGKATKTIEEKKTLIGLKNQRKAAQQGIRTAEKVDAQLVKLQSRGLKKKKVSLLERARKAFIKK